MKFLIATVCTFLLLLTSNVWSQQETDGQNTRQKETQQEDSQQDRVQAKLDEVKSMDDEEQRVIEQLKKYLRKAIDDEQPENLIRLRDEIASALDRRKTLSELQTQLEMLLEGLEENAKQAEVIRRPIFNDERPVFGDRRPVLNDERPNARRRRNLLPSEFKPKVDRMESEWPKGNDAVVRRPVPTTRLDHLRESFEHLSEAGELEMARQIEQLIQREERRLKEEAQKRRAEQQEQRARPPQLERQAAPPAAGDTRPAGRAKPPAGNDTRPAGRNRRPALNDTRPAGAAKPNPDQNMQRIIQQMRDEIRQLREELKQLKDQHNG